MPTFHTEPYQTLQRRRRVLERLRNELFAAYDFTPEKDYQLPAEQRQHGTRVPYLQVMGIDRMRSSAQLRKINAYEEPTAGMLIGAVGAHERFRDSDAILRGTRWQNTVVPVMLHEAGHAVRLLAGAREPVKTRDNVLAEYIDRMYGVPQLIRQRMPEQVPLSHTGLRTPEQRSDRYMREEVAAWLRGAELLRNVKRPGTQRMLKRVLPRAGSVLTGALRSYGMEAAFIQSVARDFKSVASSATAGWVHVKRSKNGRKAHMRRLS